MREPAEANAQDRPEEPSPGPEAPAVAARMPGRARRKWLIAIGLVAIIAAAAPFAIRRLADRDAEDGRAAEAGAPATAEIRRQDLAESTEFAGTLLFEDAVTVSASAAGVITAGPDEGQILDRGRVLYVISNEVPRSELLTAQQRVASARSQVESASKQYSQLTEQPSDASLATAQAAVAQAQQNLTELTEPPTEADLAAARADLSKAEAAYRDLFDGPSDAELAAAESNVRKAEQSVEAARTNRDSSWIKLVSAQAAYCGLTLPPVTGLCGANVLPLADAQIDDLTEALEAAITLGQESEASVMEAFLNANAAYTSAVAAVASAELGLEESRDALDRLSEGPTDAERDQALAAVRQAEERLQQLTAGPREADVLQAQASLQSAQERLDELISGADRADIRQAADAVDGARISLELALLEQAELTDGPAHAVLFYGSTPSWRTLAIGVEPGPDVRALEENLLALGFDGDGSLVVDEAFDDASVAAVEAWQASLGLEPTGEVRSDVPVYVPGPSQVSAVITDVGDSATPGAPLFDLTPLRAVQSTVEAGAVEERDVTTQRVEVQANVDDRDLFDIGTPVTIELPDGSDVGGTVSSIGAVPVIVPAQGNQPAQSYVEVTIALAETVDAIWTGADVDVSVTSKLAENVLTVPVGALLALVEGGYAVEVVEVDGGTTLVGVETGMFSDGYVEITGDGLSDGMKVVVPR